MAVFSLCCCQRQLSFYRKVANGKDWDRTVDIEEVIDKLWGAVLNDSPAVVDVSFLDMALPGEAISWAESCVLFFIQSIEDTVKIIEGSDILSAAVAPEMGLTIADQLAYAAVGKPPTSELDEMLDTEKDGVISIEIQRQCADLADICSLDFDPDVIDVLRARNALLDVTSGNWFPIGS